MQKIISSLIFLFGVFVSSIILFLPTTSAYISISNPTGDMIGIGSGAIGSTGTPTADPTLQQFCQLYVSPLSTVRSSPMSRRPSTQSPSSSVWFYDSTNGWSYLSPASGRFVQINLTCNEVGCTDISAKNYDPDADIDDGSCIPPDPIEGMFMSVPSVSLDDPSWSLTLSLNMTGVTLNPDDILIWDYAFTVDSAVTLGDEIAIQISPNISLELLECGNYSFWIPPESLEAGYSRNPAGIQGNFKLVGCETNSQNPPNNNTGSYFGSGVFETPLYDYGEGLNQSGSYIPFLNKDRNGNLFIERNSLLSVIGYVVLGFVIFSSFAVYLRTSFLGRKK